MRPAFRALIEVSNELLWKSFGKAKQLSGFLAKGEIPIKGAKSATNYYNKALRFQKALYKRSIKVVSPSK